MGQLVGGTLAKPQPPRAQPERGQRLDQRDLGRLREVERAAHRGDDRGKSVHLALSRAVLLVDMVEITACDGGGEALGHVFEAPLRDVDDLVVVRLALDRPRQKFHGGASIHGEHVNQRLERQPLRRPQTSVLA